MGQGALILEDPKAVDNPFFLLFPDWALIPMVVVATVAAVIASQAVISGAFSVTRQAVQLGFLPRLTVLHTGKEIGQVYVPVVNWAIFTAVAALVIGFGSSDHLAAAYGIAVTGTLAIDTLLFFFVVRALWHKPLWLALAGGAFFLVIDLAFFGANLPKVLHGGWFPLVVALVIFTVLVTWQNGREIVTKRRRELEGPLRRLRRGGPPPRGRLPRPAHGRVPQRQSRHHAAGAAREPRAQPHRPRDASSSSRSRRSTSRTCGRTSGSSTTTSATRTTASATSPRASASRTTSTSPRRCARGRTRLEGDVDLDEVSYFISRATISPPTTRAWRAGARSCSWRSQERVNPVRYFNLPDERRS